MPPQPWRVAASGLRLNPVAEECTGCVEDGPAECITVRGSAVPRRGISVTAGRRAAAAGLLGWAGHRSVRAEHTTVTCLGSQQCAAATAFVEILARVRWHAFRCRLSAVRASDYGFQNHKVSRYRAIPEMRRPMAWHQLERRRGDRGRNSCKMALVRPAGAWDDPDGIRHMRARRAPFRCRA